MRQRSASSKQGAEVSRDFPRKHSGVFAHMWHCILLLLQFCSIYQHFTLCKPKGYLFCLFFVVVENSAVQYHSNVKLWPLIWATLQSMGAYKLSVSLSGGEAHVHTFVDGPQLKQKCRRMPKSQYIPVAKMPCYRVQKYATKLWGHDRIEWRGVGSREGYTPPYPLSREGYTPLQWWVWGPEKIFDFVLQNVKIGLLQVKYACALCI